MTRNLYEAPVTAGRSNAYEIGYPNPSRVIECSVGFNMLHEYAQLLYLCILQMSETR